MEMSDDASFYVLNHRCTIGGKVIDRWALFCAIDLNDPLLFIHEDVFPEGVERARQATESCEADLAPIFVGCDSGVGDRLRSCLQESVGMKAALMEFRESENSVHRIWHVAEAHHKRIRELTKDEPLYVLDGHHRLAAAKANQKIGLGDGKILACVCSMAIEDTLILPIHRSIYYERWMLAETFLSDLVAAGCEISDLAETSAPAIMEVLERKLNKPFCVGLHSHATKPILILLPSANSLPPELMNLSVACLENEVLCLHPHSTRIPVPSTESLLEQLALDQSQVAFFLPPAQAEQVIAIALAKLRMPRKSTRFVPKPALGLICRPWSSL